MTRTVADHQDEISRDLRGRTHVVRVAHGDTSEVVLGLTSVFVTIEPQAYEDSLVVFPDRVVTYGEGRRNRYLPIGVRSRILPSGHVLHAVDCLKKRGGRGYELRLLYALKCLKDGEWIISPTERGAFLRFSRYVPADEENTSILSPISSEEECLDDLALDGAFD
ncbi:hypothetical protein [Aureimonas sp. N4]|uniref:hypothetical protein n=1 Tax=Aureimonas sp. N4 TaxID=1638165 RepID=UPI000784798C|nr:hypothetical protein [Aureimonas sp. N4]